jgi:hypothetical protein
MQKLLTTVFLPSVCLVSGLRYSHFQCLVRWIWPAASVWQARQALVTSGPELKVFCSSLNLAWSAVVVSLSGFGSGLASSASTGPAATSQPAQQSASAARLNR